MNNEGPIARSVCAALLLTSCTATSSDVIDRYRAAGCVTPLSQPRRIRPLTREWDQAITLRDGSSVTVYGYQAVGGKVSLRDSKGAERVVANSGDYIYPSDVRIGSPDRLYVKTSGTAAGLWRETWLFEYDLQRVKTLAQVKVDPSVLPPECPRRPEGEHSE